MLKKETITKLETLLKITGLEAAISDKEEKEITIPENLFVLTEDEFTKVKNTEYGNGKVKGVEIAVKEAKEKLGLETQSKTIEGLLEAQKVRVIADAKIEPDKKVEQLNLDLTKVRGEYETLQKTLSQKDSEVAQAKTEREIFRHVPKMEGAINEVEFVKIMELNGFEFKLEEGKPVAYKNGEKVTDKLSQVIPIADVMNIFAKEKKLITDGKAGGQGGRGVGDGKPATGYTKLSEVEAAWKAEGKSTLGQEFSAKVSELKKANPDFDMAG